MLSPPSKVKEILADLGGRVEEQKILKEAIMEQTPCKERSAKKYIQKAVESGLIMEKENPTNAKKKTYETTEKGCELEK